MLTPHKTFILSANEFVTFLVTGPGEQFDIEKGKWETLFPRWECILTQPQAFAQTSIFAWKVLQLVFHLPQWLGFVFLH